MDTTNLLENLGETVNRYKKKRVGNLYRVLVHPLWGDDGFDINTTQKEERRFG